VLLRLASAMAAPDRGGVARRGQGGMRRHRAWDMGACEGGLCGRGGPHQAGQEWGGGLVEYGAAPGPLPGRLLRAPRWRRRGAPASVQGGGVTGAGQTGRAAEAPGVAPPPRWGGCHARPAGGVIEGGRGATQREATGRPCYCTQAHKDWVGGADGSRTGRP